MNLNGLALILVCQLLGESATNVFNLPVPGPVIGMALLFLLLVNNGGPPESIKSTSSALLSLLGLFYVPAGVGLVLHSSLLADEWLPILLALVFSSVLTLVVTARLMQRYASTSSTARGVH